MNIIIGFLIILLIAAVVIWAVNLIFGLITLPPAVKQIALVIIGLIFLFWILSYFGVLPNTAVPPFNR